MNSWIITGISTSVGKTVTAAILIQMLGADYWKPIDSGEADTEMIASLTNAYCHRPTYQFQTPVSPNHAAQIEQKQIDARLIQLPATERPLIIEGCGGLLTPINEQEHLGTPFCHWNIPWIIVSKHYLGSLNHTLLTVDWLKAHNQKIHGLIFNGDTYPEGEAFLLSHTNLPCLGRIFNEKRIDTSCIQKYAHQFQAGWKGI